MSPDGTSAIDDAVPDSPARRDPGKAFHRFIGVSLGGGRGKNTAVARLEPDPDDPERLVVAEARTRTGQRGGGKIGEDHPGPPFRDVELVEWLERWVDDETVVAFDVPLTMPACVRCQLECPGVQCCEVPVVRWMREHAPSLSTRSGRIDSSKPFVTPYTQRAGELILERLTLQPREALGQGMGPLAARATYLRRALAKTLRLHENLIEAHPRATVLRAFGSELERRTRAGDDEDKQLARTEALAGLAAGSRFDRVWPELVVRNVHVFHAVVVAFTALMWGRGDAAGPQDLLAGELDDDVRESLVALGDLWREDGWIYTPPLGVVVPSVD